MAKRFRILVEITDDASQTTATAVLSAVTSEPGRQCGHAVWPAWTTPPEQPDCGWCGEPLRPCELVAGPWCDR
jgi:hypothetical protein